jgi:putative transcription factor
LPSCEVCGTVIRGPPNTVEIDGAIMKTCGNCAKMGHHVGGATRVRTAGHASSPIQMALRGYSSSSQRPALEPEYELDADYNLKVRQAREKMGISQEELGRQINEKPSVIRLIESKKLKPDSVLTRKLMHHMKLNLLAPTSDLEKIK